MLVLHYKYSSNTSKARSQSREILTIKSSIEVMIVIVNFQAITLAYVRGSIILCEMTIVELRGFCWNLDSEGCYHKLSTLFSLVWRSCCGHIAKPGRIYSRARGLARYRASLRRLAKLSPSWRPNNCFTKANDYPVQCAASSFLRRWRWWRWCLAFYLPAPGIQ